MGKIEYVSPDSFHTEELLRAVRKHNKGKILVHCADGRSKSAAVVFEILQSCFEMNAEAAFLALFKVVPHMDFQNVPLELFEPSFDAVYNSPSLGNISFRHSTETIRVAFAGNVLSVASLTPFYSFDSGGVTCSFVDYLIEQGVLRFGFARVCEFFARHLAIALEGINGPIHLVCFPPCLRGETSKLLPIIEAMCASFDGRFVNASYLLTRTSDVGPEHSDSIGEQLEHCV